MAGQRKSPKKRRRTQSKPKRAITVEPTKKLRLSRNPITILIDVLRRYKQ